MPRRGHIPATSRMTDPNAAHEPTQPRPRSAASTCCRTCSPPACLFSGFYSIVAAIDGNFALAGIAVFIAMVFDGLDGRVARWTGTESAFGKEYDSLADMVAFGVAPAVVVYQWGVVRIAEYGAEWRRFGWVARSSTRPARRCAWRVSTRARPPRTSATSRACRARRPRPSVAGFVWFFAEWRASRAAGAGARLRGHAASPRAHGEPLSAT